MVDDDSNRGDDDGSDGHVLHVYSGATYDDPACTGGVLLTHVPRMLESSHITPASYSGACETGRTIRRCAAKRSGAVLQNDPAPSYIFAGVIAHQ